MKFIIGKKLRMTQVWQGEKVVAVTQVQAGPCRVVQAKTCELDGYVAVQLGFCQRKEKNIKKPQKGHMKDLGNFSILREFRSEGQELEKGDMIDVGTFDVGDKIAVTGISKGKGFQGVVKRHGFKGTKATHGNKDQARMPGSVGATGPAHVFKGTRMGGRTGGDRVTTGNVEIIEVDKENNLLSIKGAVPGARNGLVLISGEGELKIVKSASAKSPQPAVKHGGAAKNEAGEKNNKEVENKSTEKKEAADTPEKIEKEVVEAKEKVDNKNQ